MTRRIPSFARVAALAAAVLGFALAGCSPGGDRSPTLITVGSHKITVNDFTSYAGDPQVMAPYRGLPDSLAKRTLLDDLLSYELLAEAARRQGLDKDTAYASIEKTVLPRILPDEYVPDSEEKLELYRRLAVASRLDVVDGIEAEIADRFGRPPLPATHLLELRRIRLLGGEARASEMKLDHGTLEVWLRQPLSPKQAHTLLTKSKEPLEFLSGREMGVRLRSGGGDAEAFLARARKLLQHLVEAGTVAAK